jgi:aminodeoxyfutalosine synthase
MVMEINEALSSRALAGERLSVEELAEALSADILSLGMLASDVARRQRGGAVAYRRVDVLAPERLAAGVAASDLASEVRVGALPASRAEAVEAVRAARAAAGPARVVTGFAYAALATAAAGGWGPLEALLRDLQQAGLRDLAELEADRVDDLGAAIDAVRAAGLRGHRVTVAGPLGDRKIEVVSAVRQARESRGGITMFAPLPVHPSTDVPTTGYEDLRVVALARLAFGHLAPEAPPTFIGVDWSLYGPKLAQVALTFGADFLDTVRATDEQALGHRRSTVEDVERNVRAAGLSPTELDRQARA